jgi:hypothetical protein
MLRANGKKMAAVAGLGAAATAVVVGTGVGSGPAEATWFQPHPTGTSGQKIPFSFHGIITGTITPGGTSTTKITSTSGTKTTTTTQTVTTIAHLPSVTLFPCFFATCSTSVSG